jgi:hypothetical protein
VYALRNILINGSFAIWQRGTSIDAADDEYCADRWYVLTETDNIEAARLTGDTRRYKAFLSQNKATAQQIGLAQAIEGANCQHLRGQEVTLSFRAQCDATQDIRYAVLEWGGTEDSVTSDVVATWVATPTWVTNVAPAGSVGSTSVGTTWTDIEHTVTLGSTFNNLVIFIWSGDTFAQNEDISIEAMQLEQGAHKTSFETRPIGMELALCQRYFERIRAADSATPLPGSTGRVVTSTEARIPYAFTEKRVAPSITSTTDGFDVFSVATVPNDPVLTFGVISTRGCRITATITGTMTVGEAIYLRESSSVTGAVIDIDAEL